MNRINLNNLIFASRRENLSPPKDDDKALSSSGDLPVPKSTTHQSPPHPLHPSSSSGLSDQNPSRRVPGSSRTPTTPSSPLVCPSCSILSTPHIPSAPPSPNTLAFQRVLAAAQESLTSLPSPLHPHSTLPGPPGSDPSSSDSDSEHTDIFIDNDDDMSTTTALVDVKAGLPEDFSIRNQDAR